MKKTHIVGIIVIAIAIGAMFTLLGNSSTYADFKQAGDGNAEVHVAGTLDRSKPMEYNPAVDPNKFSFYMKDRNGNEKHVVLLKSKPQDFERSQQVVIVGSMKGDDFVAKDILMKCPSKYNNGQVAVTK
ncbi:MAG: cytochrome c maturation protein CcmE [Bacteroidetes bacterium]|jgi:cytochrome c-type biogenesis protein CcmE|nr:cytochrome c maturation protein CcmE [Bacteroidota bacterium]